MSSLQKISAIADLVGWVEAAKPNITFISYLNISSLIKSEFSLRQREIAATRQ